MDDGRPREGYHAGRRRLPGQILEHPRSALCPEGLLRHDVRVRNEQRSRPARARSHHPNQDEFILVLEGELDLKLDGVWSKAKAGDLVRMPRGVPHGYFNKSDAPSRALFWVSPAGKLQDLFNALHNLDDIPRVLRLSADHDVEFLPPGANA